MGYGVKYSERVNKLRKLPLRKHICKNRWSSIYSNSNSKSQSLQSLKVLIHLSISLAISRSLISTSILRGRGVKSRGI